MDSNRPGANNSSVSITILGSGDAFASGGREQSAYLIDAPGMRVLLEAGPDVLRMLKANGIRTDSIDLLLVSHLHGDHMAGLPFLLLEYMWENPRKRPLPIIGPRKLEERTWRLVHLLYPNFDLSKPGKKANHLQIAKKLKWTVLEPRKTVRKAGLKVSAIRSPHTKPDISLSLRIEINGRTIVFSGDSGWNDELVDFASGADLFICECTYYESRHLSFHINYPDLAAHRGKFDVGRMVLTHIGSEVLNHQSDIDMELAFDGMKIEL